MNFWILPLYPYVQKSYNTVMTAKIRRVKLGSPSYPAKLSTIPRPPRQLHYLGQISSDLSKQPCVAVIGSRRVSQYGRHVTDMLVRELSRQGIIVVSGLALGVDAIAHKSAIDANGRTVAILPCGLDRIYPSSNRLLAQQILERGGVLISEYAAGTEPRKEHFIARNRIVSGLSAGILITEAAEKSGTLHTANFGLEQGREVMAVPGNITSPLSAGTNQLIKTGATPVTSVDDVLRCLKVEGRTGEQQELVADNEQEFRILDLLRKGCSEGNDLLIQSGLEPSLFNQTLTMLEISGRIKAGGNNSWLL